MKSWVFEHMTMNEITKKTSCDGFQLDNLVISIYTQLINCARSSQYLNSPSLIKKERERENFKRKRKGIEEKGKKMREQEEEKRRKGEERINLAFEVRPTWAWILALPQDCFCDLIHHLTSL